MDTKRNLDSIHIETLQRMLKRQHELNKYKLIIVTDNNAFEFAKTNYNNVFEGVPIVFCGVNHITKEELEHYPNITGVNEDVSIIKNIALIKKLQPEADTLVVIIDKTTTGRRITNEILKIDKRTLMPFKHIRILNNRSMDEVERETSALTKKCAILLGPFFSDANQQFYDFDETPQRISKTAAVPVFGLWDFNLGYGIVGGYLTDGKAQGIEAAKLAKQILSGKKPDELPIVWDSPKTYKFDYHQLKRFNIDMSLLPENSTLINEPYSLLKHNPKLFNQIAIIIIILSILSLLLILTTVRYRKLSKKHNRKNSYLKTVLNAIGDGIIEIDNNNIIRHMNFSAETLTGFQEKMGRGKKLKDIYKPRPEHDSHGEITHFKLTNNNGHSFCITQSSTPIMVSEKMQGEIIAITDITKIIEKKQQFIRLAENAKDLIYRINIPEGQFEYVSPAIGKLLGYEPIDIYKNPMLIKSCIPQEWQYYTMKIWAELKAGKNSGTNELQITHRAGQTKWINQRSVLIFDENGQPIHMEGIVTDVTAQKEIEEQLRESNIAFEEAKERAEESDKLKSAFLANIAHEIRTPMNGIMGFSELLRNKKISSGSLIRFINLIQKSSKRMLSIMDDLIHISQIEAGQIKTNIKPTHLSAILKETIARYEKTAKAKKINFSYENILHEDLNKIINTDPYKLDYAICKLLDNAIKYTTQGSVTFQCNIIDNRLWIAIKDTGIGIDKKHQQTIFARFMQADNTPFKAEEGTGLGLSIARAFIEALGGEIKLHSEKGKGSTFEFYVPLYPTAETMNQIPKIASNN